MGALRNAVNPLSTAASDWWCRSTLLRRWNRYQDRKRENGPQPWPDSENLTTPDIEST